MIQDVHFPTDAGGHFHDVVLRDAAVRQRLEFEIMVVPGEIVPRRLGGLADLGKAFAEGAPAARIMRAQLGCDMRADHHLHAERLGNAGGGAEVTLQHVEAEMPGRHGETVRVEFGAQALRIAIDAAETFDLRETRIGDEFQHLVPGLEIAGTVELE